MRRAWIVATFATFGALCGGGCMTVVTVHTGITRPARVPLRVFPRIVVVASDDAASERLGRRLVAHLEPGPSTVERATEARAQRLLGDGALRPGTVVVRVHVVLTPSDRPIIARHPRLECGPLGCLHTRRNRIEVVRELVGHVVLTVLEGSSGRTLQRETVRAEEVGQDILGMRLRVFEELVALTTRLVDQHTERVAIELIPLESSGVGAALAAIRDGEWTRGRALLEAVVSSSSFLSLSSQQRAVVLYNLGQAHRFDASVPADIRFDRASEALHAALRLDPQPRFADARHALDAQRRGRRLLLEQRNAATHNFRVAREGDAARIPEPPTSYR